MRIAVLLSHLPPDGPSDSLSCSIAPCELAALTTATELAATAVDCRVVAVLVGAQPDESTLIEAGQRGAHELVRVWYDAVPADESDTQLIAGLLACALRRLDVNLVLAGAWSGRRRRGVIGAAIAHALQLPHVSEVRAIRFDSDPRRVQLRQTRPVMEVSLILPMPAVLTVSSTSDTTPAANQEAPPIRLLTAEELQFDPEGIYRVAAAVPRQTTKRTLQLLNKADELLALLERSSACR